MPIQAKAALGPFVVKTKWLAYRWALHVMRASVRAEQGRQMPDNVDSRR